MNKNYDFDSDKAFLKIKMSEYQMLNNTLIEMIERGTSEIGIDEIKGAIKETEDDIAALLKRIEDESNKEDKNVEYSFYDGITKPKLAKSVKLASFVKDKSFDGTKDENTTLKFLNTETNGKYVSDIITNANRFLVRFNGALNISEWLVKSVDFAPSDRNELYITIQDHLATSSDGTKYPIISQIRSRVNSSYEPSFVICIEYLDRTGCTIYTERYHGCRISDVIRSSVSYDTDDFNTINFTVTYTDVTYETQKL